MRYYPVNIDVRGRRCVVIGGGAIAARRVRTLLAAGARVVVVSPSLGRSLAALLRKRKFIHRSRKYRRGDLRGARLAFVATGSAEISGRVRAEADASGVWLNAADEPDLCDFTIPARVVRGDLLLTVSTGGRSPGLARLLRLRLERSFGPEWARLLQEIGRARRLVLTESKKFNYNKKLLESLLDPQQIEAALRAGRSRPGRPTSRRRRRRRLS